MAASLRGVAQNVVNSVRKISSYLPSDKPAHSCHHRQGRAHTQLHRKPRWVFRRPRPHSQRDPRSRPPWTEAPEHRRRHRRPASRFDFEIRENALICRTSVPGRRISLSSGPEPAIRSETSLPRRARSSSASTRSNGRLKSTSRPANNATGCSGSMPIFARSDASGIRRGSLGKPFCVNAMR